MKEVILLQNRKVQNMLGKEELFLEYLYSYYQRLSKNTINIIHYFSLKSHTKIKKGMIMVCLSL